ncbi:CdaR family protein [Streptococcus loxodontisalivarius]|uniref:CdaR family protein n=1 Tax=Streptococcus loxodontisalivarius TaxID=1349415 RepID=UPI001961BA45
MKRFFQGRFFYLLVAFLFAISLFLTAASSSYNQSGTQLSQVTETYTNTIEDVPIDIKYDSDNYFISGYSYQTTVYLTSTNRVKLDSEINSDTRSFKVVADLSDASSGTTTAKLKVTNLPSGMTATVSPDTISVTIGKKVSKTFKVVGNVNDDQIADGYALKKVSVDTDEVTVVSDESTMSQIDHVVANLPEDQVLDSNYSGNVTLQAVSADGTVLASVIDPAKVGLSVTVKRLSKTVPVRIEQTGSLSSDLSSITTKASQDTVTIYGNQDALDAISEVVGQVDISDVTKNVTKTINLSATNVTVDPATIGVDLTVTKK